MMRKSGTPDLRWGGGGGGGVSDSLSERGANTPTSTSSPQGGGEPVASGVADLRKRKPISGLPEMGREESLRYVSSIDQMMNARASMR